MSTLSIFVIALFLAITTTPANAESDDTVADKPSTTQDSRPQYGLGHFPETGLTELDKSLEDVKLFRSAMDNNFGTGISSKSQSGKLGQYPVMEIVVESYPVELVLEAGKPPKRPPWVSVPENLKYLLWCVDPGPNSTDVAANKKCADGLKHLAEHYEYMVNWNNALVPNLPSDPTGK